MPESISVPPANPASMARVARILKNRTNAFN